ncbi:hypothetical protein A3A64_03715 [Candidatus Gottesmanbacteria bacterium RIFCSPLOWO2_01_FULL_48_11]|uniref:Peptidase M23 n=3 Tax=Candidatus Gottesmaniibacteriota TaxID=1752720 RepID=A0A0G1UPT3_9BACT|nr:MAG: Peptidase M23 [Candidatus Gottesmanbacteria bacterium GW2011_GWA2_47_9]KKU96237.1 MAG: Peptidase M23 [Candidatus Gottesmanbacteria bacterium GW2011_GWA1_48_13]OGG27504.1 MAG: hypothetical protein A3A64_03715 [Candidatus Gottesmanbacteria bacterium RIFCSPLOWO2_01_FULL_48_11]HCS79380.1 hypothetical protein [Patescibacteria group bacterium]
MNQLLSWFTATYHGSNRVSFWLRRSIEKLPFKQFLGVQLAGFAFVAAVLVPQASDIAGNWEVLTETETTVVSVTPTQSRFRWPLPSFGLSQRFHLGHPGVDLTAPRGTPVFAVAEGWVAWATSSLWGYGKHLLVQHDKGIQSLYAHLSEISVKQGDTVTKDTQLGTVGSTGWSTGNHLHLELYQDGTPINPLEVLPEIK